MSVFNKGRNINAFEVDPEDPIFLNPAEHTFLFFGSSLPIVRMLAGKKENYTAGTINFREMSLNPTDLVGKKCSHSKRVVEEIHTACIGLHQNHVKYLFHEAEFAKWFASQDKDKLKPYRFVRPRKKTLVVEDGSFKIQINNGEKLDEYTFEALNDIPYSAVVALGGAESSLQTGTGTPAQAGGGGAALASLVGAPSLVSADGGMSTAGMDVGWRGGGADPGMSDVSAPAAGPPGAGMTMAGEAMVPGAGAGLAGLVATPGTGGATTQTVVVCPHCQQAMMIHLQASKVGGDK